MRRKVLFWLGVALILGVFVVPILWIYLTSFKAPEDIYCMGSEKLVVFTPTLVNYWHLFWRTDFPMEIRNTAIMSVASTALVMVVSLPAAYSFARFNTGSGHLLFITISTRMFPGVVAAIPFFFAFRALGLLDTHFGLILLLL